jgi:hypothetical protein
MVHYMILTILLLTLAAMLAMRRIEEDMIKQYQKDRHDRSDIL